MDWSVIKRAESSREGDEELVVVVQLLERGKNFAKSAHQRPNLCEKNLSYSNIN